MSLNQSLHKLFIWFYYTSLTDNTKSETEVSEVVLRSQNEKYCHHIKAKSWAITRDKPNTHRPPVSSYGQTSKEEYSRNVGKGDRMLRGLNSQLLDAVEQNDVGLIKRLLSSKANPNATCRLSHVSACHMAALNRGDALKILLNSGANKQRVTKQGHLPLHFAAWVGNIQNIGLLLNLPLDTANGLILLDLLNEAHSNYPHEELKPIISHNKNLVTINVACDIPCDSVLPKTWSDNVDHNCVQNKENLPHLQPGWTALHAACAKVNLSCVRFLLAIGADPAIKDLLGRTPLDVLGFAFHFGFEVNVNDFIKVIDLLLVSGVKFTTDTMNNERSFPSYYIKKPNDDQKSNVKINTKAPVPCLYDTPLHTAVLVGSVDAIKHLLGVGASVHALNGDGQTPMHVCVQKKLKDHLQFLAGYDNADPFITTVDIKNLDGRTVLHAAIKECWMQGVCIALASGACITMKDKNGETPLHAAAVCGDKSILQEIAAVAEENFVINHRDIHGRTALYLAIMQKNLDGVKILIEHGASISRLLSNNINALQVAAKIGTVDILDFIVNNQDICEETMINEVTNAGIAPIQYAVNQNHPECVKLLISKNAKLYFPVDKISNDNKYITPLHIAASKNQLEIAKIIVNFDEKTIHQMWDGYLPLHDACRYGNRDVIDFLLKKGCDLSSYTEGNNMKATAIGLLMENLAKPTDFLEALFDSYISCNNLDPHNKNYEVTVDYKVLNPDHEGPIQMNVIKALLKTGNRHDQKRLLLHPLVESFLCWKWRNLLPFFYIMLSLYGCFVMALNGFVIAVLYFDERDKILPIFWNYTVWKYMLYVTIVFILAQEIIYTRVKSKSYFFWLEMAVKVGAIGLSVVLPLVLYPSECDTGENIRSNYTIAANTTANEVPCSSSIPEESRLLATIAVLLSWLQLTFLLARLPSLGFYVLMFGKVATQVMKILLTFIFFIFGFALSFMIHFHSKKPFEGPWASLVKTVVMMSSEFDYNDILDYEEEKLAASIILNRIIFVIFLILTSIVLMNLMVGVAVNDLYNLKLIGNIKRIETQVEFLSSLESIVYHKTFRDLFPHVWARFIERNKVGSQIILRPNRWKCNYSKHLPPGLKQAIFEKAQQRNSCLDEVRYTETDKIKLEEIHRALLSNCENESKNNVNNIMVMNKMMMKLYKKVEKLNNDVDMMKEMMLRELKHTK